MAKYLTTIEELHGYLPVVSRILCHLWQMTLDPFNYLFGIKKMLIG